VSAGRRSGDQAGGQATQGLSQGQEKLLGG
jgi:hypothetical protein